MKHKLYKVSLLFFFVGSVFAQKTSKNFSEQFYTNKDVEIEINASNTDIEVVNWNKNEVSVEAEIIIEGVSKKEAEKYFKNCVFEALGNKSKVKINANDRRNSRYNFNNDFVYFNADSIHIGKNNMKLNGNVVFGKPLSSYTIHADSISSNFKLPEVIGIPEVNYETLYVDFDEFDFDKYEKEGGNYFFQWQDGVNNVTVKSKKEWEEFKKTKEYKKYKESVKKRRKEFKERTKMLEKRQEAMNKAQRKTYEAQREAYEKARLIHKKNEERLRKHVAKVVNGKANYKYVYSVRNNNFLDSNKKVKITRKLIIKAPKKATFNLNTRHCKVKLPNAKVSGRVSYGTFFTDGLTGGNLKTNFVNEIAIKHLNACTLFVNNSSLANIEELSKAKLNVNSSNVNIDVINQGVTINNKFGDTKVYNINPNFNDLTISLTNSGINLPLKKVNTNLDVDFQKSKFQFVNGTKSNHKKLFELLNKSDISIKSKIYAPKKTNNNITIKGKYAILTIF